MEKWGWYGIFASLASMDILKMEAVQQMNVHDVHLFLAYSQDKKEVDDINARTPKNGMTL